jgi:ppGpp synthetase/RelA/SpoT-type nucleotidyltranferase
VSNTAVESWLDEALVRHVRLTDAVISITKSILHQNAIDYLAVSGRTKDRKSTLEKIKRKGYTNPAGQITDLSGIRIILYFESDVQKVAAIISNAFSVDEANSSNKDDGLSPDQIGYRSVHYVCDLGHHRVQVQEYKGLEDLKFEFQIRTVLQHAWAELSHDRKYKFSGKLPREIERKLYLYAGLLEIADRGFDELAKAIDDYSIESQKSTSAGNLDIEINTLTLTPYMAQWAAKNNFHLEQLDNPDYVELIRELSQFGIKTLADLDAIIPPNYVEVARQNKFSTTILGAVRDWMLIKDWRRFVRDVEFSWVLSSDSIVKNFFDEDEFASFDKSFDHMPLDDDYEFDWADDSQ